MAGVGFAADSCDDGGDTMAILKIIRCQIHYQCGVCHTEYKYQRDAEICERYHVWPTSHQLAGEYHKPYNQQGTGYPDKIIVEMQDGKKLEYKR